MRSSFKERQIRARQWLARETPAEPLLLFYLELLEIQEPICGRTVAANWGERVRPRGDGADDGPVEVALLPVPDLVADFRRFVEDVAPMATEVLAAIAGSLEAADDAVAIDLLETFLARGDLAVLAGGLGCDETALEFFPRAFLQPLAETVTPESAATGEVAAESERWCPRCGWPPQVAALRDEAEIKGRRLLVCSLCGSWWPFPRGRCAACGETDAAQLVYHISETLAHVRVDECRSCRAYLKSIDLREDGKAVPLVDDLATVELDLWSADQGLRKIQRNLLGL